MPGDDWQGFANLRALLGYQWLFPGKQLLFMGGEIGQRNEWNANGSIDWHLLDQGPYHRGLQRFVEDLNRVYRSTPAMYESDFDYEGFFWIDCTDQDNSVLSFMRQNRSLTSRVMVALNLTPVPRMNYRLGLPQGGYWREILNSDAEMYGGGNLGNYGGVNGDPWPLHNQPFSAAFTLPPLSITAFSPS